jgi:hypothetical protein
MSLYLVKAHFKPYPYRQEKGTLHLYRTPNGTSPVPGVSALLTAEAVTAV